VRGIGFDDPPLPGRRALPNRPTAAMPHPPVSAGSGTSRPRTCSQPAYGHARPEHLTEKRMTARVAKRSASLVMTGFENSSMPWSLSVPVAEPRRTWPPSGPTRSRPWRPPSGMAAQPQEMRRLVVRR
jgi:hypothetical protein